jgi:hypothetical protein
VALERAATCLSILLFMFFFVYKKSPVIVQKVTYKLNKSHDMVQFLRVT